MKMRSMEEIIAHFHHTMNSTEMTLEVALEFWLHENWLVSLGLLVEDDNQLPSMSLQLLREHAAANEQLLRTPFKVKYIQIASQGELLWEDLISSESVGTQLLGKNDKLRYIVPPNELFITKIQTQQDVCAVQLNCVWSSTVPMEEMNFVVEIIGTGTVAEDLVIGSFKPVSIIIWNVRNAHRDHFADAVMDLCARILADVIFLFNTRLTSDGAVQGILETLPYDTQYSTTEQDLRGGSTVMWNGS
ncbi:hypothetical protein SLEP1_g17432 [Rubroshorea leprosula]|uniref:Uncharacterized protein n=1 Tax=Rubroshorea leprosula TaxID=152421 RepID=A0AAV5J357_9ROSI|nr:hypothetical protein SLEP1_g17432 [Rubroshorea leprosula]